ncbi:MAG TPA: CRISPR-associated endonuclease Cas3'' [Kofleriaceae bacterium]|nr:CRISPR-associated endonuclease Cas3'' [Kofleriaceae bacterium]
MTAQVLAHVAADGRLHLLDDHLRDVAELAGRFGAAFGAGEHAALAGLWHDLGKYSGDFQRLIHSANGLEAHIEAEGNERDHSTAGAVHMIERGGPKFYPLAAAIAGHHAGLADFDELRRRLKGRRHLYEAVLRRQPPEELLKESLPALPEWMNGATSGDTSFALRLEMWGRMLFSALCDADFLDTERFFAPERFARRAAGPHVGELAARLKDRVLELESRAPATEVNRARRDVRLACEARAADPPGFFSLTVPTGGGKTLAAMAFALEHAQRHGLDRVIVVIPYTSIIEQSAKVYRSIFGEGAVIEHHSGVDPLRENPLNRLSSENWDAPIIVTTTVQFFESLFANRPGACRKLHNVSRSVIVLDEAQAVPGELLPAILDGLTQLVRRYGATVVISTATQPAWQRSERLPVGLDTVSEVCPPELDLFGRLRRVEVVWPERDEPVSYETLAGQVALEASCLAVVHRRDDARDLCRQVDRIIGDESTIHLSALMTPAHRSLVLSRVRDMRSRGEDVRVVSTQLVEAGVDLDFPVVFRALAGLDSLAQAAGRCNREGRLERGQLRVFIAPTDPPPGVPLTGRDVARMLRREKGALDIFDPVTQREYFAELYARTALERGMEVQRERARLNYRRVSESFKLIRDGWSAPLVIAHDDGADRVDALRQHGPSRDRLRALQPYTINVPRRLLDAWARSGAASSVAETVHALEGPRLEAYDRRFGLVPERMGSFDPSWLIVG